MLCTYCGCVCKYEREKLRSYVHTERAILHTRIHRENTSTPKAAGLSLKDRLMLESLDWQTYVGQAYISDSGTTLSPTRNRRPYSSPLKDSTSFSREHRRHHSIPTPPNFDSSSPAEPVLYTPRKPTDASYKFKNHTPYSSDGIGYVSPLGDISSPSLLPISRYSGSTTTNSGRSRNLTPNITPTHTCTYTHTHTDVKSYASTKRTSSFKRDTKHRNISFHSSLKPMSLLPHLTEVEVDSNASHSTMRLGSGPGERYPSSNFVPLDPLSETTPSGRS
ncbi:hypothetical protein AAMO2058_000646500 [Amorphochlora amoebiformis]